MFSVLQSAGSCGENQMVCAAASASRPSRPRTNGITTPAVQNPWWATASCGQMLCVPENTSVTNPRALSNVCFTDAMRELYPCNAYPCLYCAVATQLVRNGHTAP